MMDSLDLLLHSLRYTPLCLMGIGVAILLRIQIKELKKS